jgi:N-acetylmuramoyl-L-alanine amidase
MLSSPDVTAPRIRALLLVATLFVAAAASAQEPPPEPVPTPAALVARGTGALVVEQQSLALPWAATPAGPLVALAPVVARLGGALEAAALGEGYALALGEVVSLLAPGSPSLTQGAEILALTQAPLVADGELFVPIDLLQRTFGAVLGIGFEWQEGGTLLVNRPRARDLPVAVDLVHLQGISTLVLRFPEPPRYRVRAREGGVDVELLGDRAIAPARREWGDDPLVKAIDIAPERIRIDLAPGTGADHYELREPFRLVFDIVQRSEAVVGSSALPAGSAPRRSELRTIVLDPGHGGSETGAKGPLGTEEKELTLQIALELRERLAQRLGVKVLLTRTEDVDLALDERAALANQNKADLFVSIHLNSSPRGGARGAETYLLSLQASDQRAASTAELENLGAPTPGAEDLDPGLQLILWDLAQSQHLAASQRLAAVIQEELNAELELTDRGVKQAPFRVLMGAAMPAVLVELGFISTREEEERLRTPAYRAELAEALVRAIGRFKAAVEGTAAPAAPASPTVPADPAVSTPPAEPAP